MHGMLETDADYTIMAADITSAMKHHPMAGFSVSLSGDNAGALRGYWEKLSTSGTTTMLMQKQIRGDEFGMCVEVRRLVAGRHQPAAGLAAHPGARPPHLARRRRGSAGRAGDRHNAGQTPTSGVLRRPPAPSRPGHRSPRPALRHARARQFARPGSVMDVRLRKMDTEEQRSALRAAVYRGDGPAVVFQLAGVGRSLPGSATREGNRCVARGLGVRGGTAVIGVPAGERACA